MSKGLSSAAAMRRLRVSDKTFRELVRHGWLVPAIGGGQGVARSFDADAVDRYRTNADYAEVLAAAVHVRHGGNERALRDFARHVRTYFSGTNARSNGAVSRFRAGYPGLSYWTGRGGVPTVSEVVRSNVTSRTAGRLRLEVDASTRALARRVCARLRRHEVPYLIGLVVADGFPRERWTALQEYVSRALWDRIAPFAASGGGGPEFSADLRNVVSAREDGDYQAVAAFVEKYTAALGLPAGLAASVLAAEREKRRAEKLPNPAAVARVLGLSRSRAYALSKAVRRIPREDFAALFVAGDPAETLARVNARAPAGSPCDGCGEPVPDNATTCPACGRMV